MLAEGGYLSYHNFSRLYKRKRSYMVKFLHTADLHIGKRTEGRLRLEEQRTVLNEIVAVARAEKVGLALVAGDVFDVSSPSAEAKRLFYRFALDLAAVCPVVAVAGNHDGAADLSAPAELAEAAEIRLLGAPARLNYRVGGENVNIAAVPYPDERALAPYEGEYADRVAALLRDTCGHFTSGENNILLSHLFITGANEEADENTLGPARMLPKTVLPAGCYAALGHIHKPSTVSKHLNAYYAGSPLNYHFEGDNAKSVIIGEMTDGAVREVRRVGLATGRTLVTETVSDFDGALAALDSHEGDLVKLRYVSGVPLTLSETKKLRSYECFVKLEPIVGGVKETAGAASVKTKSDEELFRAYYASRYGEPPSDSIMTLFADVMSRAKGDA